MDTPLGFIPHNLRTQAQSDAHEESLKRLVQFSLPCPQLAKGESLKLTDFHNDPRVVADRGGVKFTRIHQWTGSCVWAGGTNALTATIAAARCSDDPMVGIIPFTLHNYALSRHYMGDDNQGSGSLGSTFFKSLGKDGVVPWMNVSGDIYPDYRDRGEEGIDVDSSRTEFLWSSSRTPLVSQVLALSQQHVTVGAGRCKTTQDVKAMVLNGYGVSFACDRYIGHGYLKGSGDKSRVMGKWDTSGGHQQYVVGYEEHEDFGPIYLVGNNWPRGTYPITPSQPVCFVWVLDADLAYAMQHFQAEVFGIGRPNGFPGQPELLDYIP